MASLGVYTPRMDSKTVQHYDEKAKELAVRYESADMSETQGILLKYLPGRGRLTFRNAMQVLRPPVVAGAHIAQKSRNHIRRTRIRNEE